MKRAVLAFLILLVGCEQQKDHGWLGYAEGDNAFIAAPQAGWVSRMTVERGKDVKRGELLFTLDDTRETASRAQAQATLAQTKAQLREAEANLDYATKELSRQNKLVAANAGARATLDLAQSNHDQAAARISQIRAQQAQGEAALANAAYQLSQRDVVSLTDGRVEDIYFRTGEYVPAGSPVVSVLPPQNIYVRFFVPESEFAKVKMGDRVAISCDGCAPNLVARVTFIAQQQEFTPPVIFSEQNREKLVFKLEARASGGLKLHPGQPAEVRLLPQ
ncbi:MAG: HlyD family secretion protein [Proteobacteria bacterium]|nr:HlyD family secretion protein [Pseudomonadota bacterium]